MPSVLLKEITSPSKDGVRREVLSLFAKEAGWHPTFLYNTPSLDNVVTTHLFVEHGLSHTAVLSFLRQGTSYSSLSPRTLTSINQISYNNLSDWQILIDQNSATYFHNRISSFEPVLSGLVNDSIESAHTANFFHDKTASIEGKKISNVEDALLATIKYWKVRLVSILDQPSINKELARLFNAIILARTLEDVAFHNNKPNQSLISLVEPQDFSLDSVLQKYFESYDNQFFSKDYLETLKVFNRLDPYTVNELLRDFYGNERTAPYKFDFATMSIQALSRVYERYIALLSPKRGGQLDLFQTDHYEELERLPGTVFTPQYIARFFARYVLQRIGIERFTSAKIIDPACGSGIFLREALEVASENDASNLQLKTMVEKISGHDIDETACESANLSLSLFQMSRFGKVLRPEQIDSKNALSEFEQSSRRKVDVLLANPPFVKYDKLSIEDRQLVTSVLGDLRKNKPDLFAAFLKGSADLVKPGGFLCMVLPHAFLTSSAYADLRKHIGTSFTIELVVDLSKVNVFPDVSAYTILLIGQKRPARTTLDEALVVTCQTNPAEPLLAVLNGDVPLKEDAQFKKLPPSTSSRLRGFPSALHSTCLFLRMTS